MFSSSFVLRSSGFKMKILCRHLIAIRLKEVYTKTLQIPTNWYCTNTWIICTRACNHITGNEGILHDLFSSLSLLVATLANGSTHVKSIDTASLLLSSVFYMPKFSFHLLWINKLKRFLNCSVNFFLDNCVFQEFGMKKMAGKERVWRSTSPKYWC